MKKHIRNRVRHSPTGSADRHHRVFVKVGDDRDRPKVTQSFISELDDLMMMLTNVDVAYKLK